MKKVMISALALTTIMFSSCNSPSGGVQEDSLGDATADTAVMYGNANERITAEGVEIKEIGEGFWNSVDFNAPAVDVPGLRDLNIEKRATDGYNIYTTDEAVLFDTDKAAIRDDAAPKLQEIVKEIKDIPGNGQIRVFGFTDATASADYNLELSQQRAQAVKDWLQSKGGIDASRISIEPMGEKAPVASNETAAGRQKNRRVSIVAITK